MHFLFPTGSTPNEPDEIFAEQQTALSALGYSTSLCSDAVLIGIKQLQGIPSGSTVVYRGWMTTADEYRALVRAINQAGGTPLTNQHEYLTAHHLPNWYPMIPELTPETHVFPTDADLVSELNKLNWGSYFIKDYVKSLKTDRGSVVHDPNDAPKVVADLKEYRGRIEGGICVRRVEEFIPETEQRFFVLHGSLHSSSNDPIPIEVRTCAERIQSPFFSIDSIRRRDGTLRIVEVGDGQVSDLVGWSADSFAQIWV